MLYDDVVDDGEEIELTDEQREQQRQNLFVEDYVVSYLESITSGILTGDGCFVAIKGSEVRFGQFNVDQMVDQIILRDGSDVTLDGWRLVGSGRFVEWDDYGHGYTKRGAVAWKSFKQTLR